MLGKVQDLPSPQDVAPTRLPAVVPATLVELSPYHAGMLADYLEEQHLTEILADRQVLDYELLKVPASSTCFLDLSLLVQVAPMILLWFQERCCPLQTGCRVVLRKERAALDSLLTEYGGSLWEWNGQGYAVVPAPAQEFSIALDLVGCPHLLQLELPGAGYLDVGVTNWRPRSPQRRRKARKC